LNQNNCGSGQYLAPLPPYLRPAVLWLPAEELREDSDFCSPAYRQALRDFFLRDEKGKERGVVAAVRRLRAALGLPQDQRGDYALEKLVQTGAGGPAFECGIMLGLDGGML
jgi:hypothetical protein